MTTVAPERTAGSYESLGPTRAGAASRFRAMAPWVAILVLGALALVAVGMRGSPEARLLDPRDTSGIGARALAQVLQQQGVEITVVTTMAQLPAQVPAGTTVVVTADDRISPSRLSELATRARSADRLVVLLVEPQTVDLLVPGLAGYSLPTMWPVVSAPASRCDVAEVRPGDSVTGGLVGIYDESDQDTADHDNAGAAAGRCLPTRDFDGGELLAHVPAGAERTETFLVGFGGGLSNDDITSEDNAAVALRMLGQSPRLLWLIPSGADGRGDAAGDGFSPWPAWSTPVALVLMLGVVLLALIRGRRLGRLVTEPLPVTVRAAETTESRGNLYRRSQDTARTAAILRDGTRRRLRRRLGVGRTEPLDTLVTAVVTATGEPRDRVQTLLTDAESVRAKDLVRLGSDLQDLERKVRLT